MLTISNANPFQFWLTGEETFNQKEVCSIYPVCFCEQIDPSEYIGRLDIIDTTDSANYILVYLDDGSIYAQYQFSIGNDHHQYLFITDSVQSLENRKILLKITSASTVKLTVPSSWSDALGGFSFTKSSTQFTASHTGAGGRTYAAKKLLQSSIPSGTLIKFPFTILGGGSWLGFVSVVFYDSDPDSGGTPVGTQSFSGLTSGITYNENVSITLTGDATYIVISTLLPNTGSAENIVITIPVGYILFAPDNTVLASTDCIDIVSDDCTQLIKYSNSTSFAGLDFTLSSPSTDFQLRIPAVFFEENYPQEQEDLELSDDTIVTLWSKIEAKKTLDIGYMPFYMHLKLQMILMMDDVTIDGVSYRLRDPYQITPSSSKRSALRRASVVLSQKDFIDRNLL